MQPPPLHWPSAWSSPLVPPAWLPPNPEHTPGAPGPANRGTGGAARACMVAPVGHIGALGTGRVRITAAPCSAAPPRAALRHLTAARGPGRSCPRAPIEAPRQQRSRDRVRRTCAAWSSASTARGTSPHALPSASAMADAGSDGNIAASCAIACGAYGDACDARGGRAAAGGSASWRVTSAGAVGPVAPVACDRSSKQPSSHRRSSAMRAARGGRTCVAAGAVAATWGAVAGAACRANKRRRCLTPCALAGMRGACRVQLCRTRP